MSGVFVTAPARDRVNAVLVVHRPVAMPRECPVSVLADGQLASLPTMGVTDRPQWRELHTAASIDTLRRMTTASRVAGRVCDQELRLGPDQQATLRELLARFDEEVRFAAQP